MGAFSTPEHIVAEAALVQALRRLSGWYAEPERKFEADAEWELWTTRVEMRTLMSHFSNGLTHQPLERGYGTNAAW